MLYSILNPPGVQYEQRQALADLQYRREYASWLATLPPADRQALKQKGLHHALIDYHASESARDVTERNISYEPAYEVYPAPDSRKREYENLCRVAILIVDSANPRLEADILSFTLGLYTREGKSGTELAAKYGLSRAAWSKRCKRFQAQFD